MKFGIPPYFPHKISTEEDYSAVVDPGSYPGMPPTGIDSDKYQPDGEINYLQYLGFLEELRVGGEMREIVTWFNNGERYVRRCRVIWSSEALKQMPVAGADGIYYQGEILLSLKKSDAGGLPKPGLFIESPPGTVYRILDVVDDHGTYALKLVRNS